MTIEQLRSAIDTVDQEILSLLNKRAILAVHIGGEKKRQQLPVKDEQREKQVLQQLTVKNTGPLSSQQIITIFQAIINECRHIQVTKDCCKIGKNVISIHQSAERNPVNELNL